MKKSLVGQIVDEQTIGLDNDVAKKVGLETSRNPILQVQNIQEKKQNPSNNGISAKETQ